MPKPILDEEQQALERKRRDNARRQALWRKRREKRLRDLTRELKKAQARIAALEAQQGAG